MILKAAMDKKKLLAQKDIYGNRATHLAVISNSPEILKMLVRYGASKDITNDVVNEWTLNSWMKSH